MIALDSPQWSELRHAHGAATDTPAALASLIDQPIGLAAEETWVELYGSLLHHGTVYPAAIAAVPHVVRIASRIAAADRFRYLDFAGAVATRVEPPADDDPLWRECVAAFAVADRMIDGLLATADDDQVVAVAAARAAFAGCPAIARVLRERADGITFEINCPVDDCGVTIAIDFVGPRGLAAVDEAAIDLVAATLPAFDPSRPWTEVDAVARLAIQLRVAGRDSAAAIVAAIESTVACPHCGTGFGLRETLLDPREL